MPLAGLILAVTAMQGPPAAVLAAPAPQPALFAPGTRLPVRFMQSMRSGRDRVGTVVRALTMTDLEAGGCVAVPAFTPLLATITVSRRGGLFGRGGELDLRFDSILAAGRRWVPVSAVLDSLEWTPRRVWEADGEVRRGTRSVPGILGVAGAATVAGLATGVGIFPAAAITGLDLARRGRAERILTGQRGRIRLTAPFTVPMPSRCERPLTWDSVIRPPLPPLAPRSTNQRGTQDADPINLVLRGTREDVDSAFDRAGWVLAQRSTLGTLAKEVGAIVISARDAAAPMSHEYYLGRVEDLRFERASPSARARHHVRLWQVDATGTLWAAAATEDVGMLVSPRRRTVTHRIAPDIDRERDLLASELLGGGCAAPEGYATLPGAVRADSSVAGQKYFTDGRAVVLRLGSCLSR